MQRAKSLNDCGAYRAVGAASVSAESAGRSPYDITGLGRPRLSKAGGGRALARAANF